MKLRQLITRRRAKWAGLVLCVVLGVVFVSSRWAYAVAVVWPSPSVSLTVGIEDGRLALTVDRFMEWLPARRPWARYAGLVADPGLRLWLDWDGWNMGNGIMYSSFRLPLWMPLLLMVGPTIWLWYTDRRAKPWQCAKCRYDLRGLDGGVCPECGAATNESKR